eukprot:s1758_g4.t1
MEASSLGTGSVCNWDWQRELEVFAGRISRGRADEAAAARRAGEEAERTALQRVQEAERRQLAWQTEESAALQNFLTGWHYAMDLIKSRSLGAMAHMACETVLQAQDAMEVDEIEILRVPRPGIRGDGASHQWPQPQAKRRRMQWASRLEMGDIDQGELWVRMQRFQEHWFRHDLRAASDARFEQLAAQMATLQKRSEEDAAEGVRNSTLVEALTARLDKYEVKAQADLQKFQQDLKDKEQQMEQLKTSIAEVGSQVSSCQTELKGLKEAQEAMSTVEHRLQEVETRGSAVARGLRALEPFVEQVTARLEPLEPAIEGIRSELSASSQIHRTSIAAQGKRMEEGFKALQDEVAKYQEDGPRLMQAVQEVEAVAEDGFPKSQAAPKSHPGAAVPISTCAMPTFFLAQCGEPAPQVPGARATAKTAGPPAGEK